jgi:hypothetical protein
MLLIHLELVHVALTCFVLVHTVAACTCYLHHFDTPFLDLSHFSCVCIVTVWLMSPELDILVSCSCDIHVAVA